MLRTASNTLCLERFDSALNPDVNVGIRNPKIFIPASGKGSLNSFGAPMPAATIGDNS